MILIDEQGRMFEFREYRIPRLYDLYLSAAGTVNEARHNNLRSVKAIICPVQDDLVVDDIRGFK